MTIKHQIKPVATKHENGYHIFTFSVSIKDKEKQYVLYISEKDLFLKKKTTNNLNKFAKQQIEKWLIDSKNTLPKQKYCLLINGGLIPTNDIDAYLSVKKKTYDLVRTNITISAPLFEWAKSKAQKEETSLSELVSRGLTIIKNSDQPKKSNEEAEAWFEKQGTQFRNKLGDYGSFEVFHYLPNNDSKFDINLIKNSLQTAEQRRTGWPIGLYFTAGEQRPQPQVDGIKAEYPSSNYIQLDYWYAKHKGEFYFARNLASDGGNGRAKPKTCLYFDTLIWRVAESLEHCMAYYRSLNINDNDRIKIKISLYGLKGRKLSAWNQGRAFALHRYSCGSDKSFWETETSLTEMTNNLDDIIYGSVKKLFVLFDFFVPAKEVVNDILNNEYRKSRM